MTRPRDHRRRFRELLLPNTLRHAVTRVPGYASLYRGLDVDFDSVEGLPRLPLTSKAIFKADAAAFRDPTVPAVAIQHTGGTTGQPLILQRGRAELGYIRDFFHQVVHDAEDAEDAPLCITALGNFHGDPTPVPYPGRVFALDVNDLYWDLDALFSRPGSIIGGTVEAAVLVGLESQIRIITCRLIESGFDFSRSVVRAVHTTGDLMTPRLCRFYEATWRCPVSSRYSMSEMFGGASVCRRCNYRHFNPEVIGEVVDARSNVPIDRGHGVLVVTCLYPFLEKQPLIRYRTGDLVEVGPRDCEIDELAFVLKGREFSSVFDDSPGPAEPLLCSGTIYSILDDYPDVASSEFQHVFKSLKGVSDPTGLGHLKFATTWLPEASDLRLDVELRYLPYMYKERSRSVCDEIRQRLVNASPRLASRIEDGLLFAVRAVHPGQLNHTQVDEVE